MELSFCSSKSNLNKFSPIIANSLCMAPLCQSSHREHESIDYSIMWTHVLATENEFDSVNQVEGVSIELWKKAAIVPFCCDS